MRFVLALYGLLGVLCDTSWAALSDYIDEIPTCGLQCIATVLPESPCKVATNTTCICSDQTFATSASICVATECSVIDALAVQRVQAEACGAPVRSRRNDFWGLFPLELLTLACILLRLWSRYANRINFGVDDYMTIAMLPFWLSFTICGSIARYTAFGVDIYTITEPSVITNGLQLFYICETFYFVTLGLTKVLVLNFYLRIFPNEGFRVVTFLVMGYVVVSTLVGLFLQIFQCQPVPSAWKAWTGTFGAHTCLDINMMATSVASNLIAQDVIVLLLPLPLLARLNMSWRKRGSIMLMFSLGIFAVITSSIRLRYLIIMAKTTNPTYDYTDVIIWTALEVDVSVIVACMPTIRSYLSEKFKFLVSTNDKSSKGTMSSDGRYKETSKPLKRLWRSQLLRLSSRTPTQIMEESHDSQIELGDKIMGFAKTDIEAISQAKVREDGTGISESDKIYVQRTTVIKSSEDREW